MRILHCVASLAPRHGGPTVAVLGMVRAQREQGVDAVILSSDDDVGDRLDVPLRQWTQHEGVPVLFLPRVPARQHTLVGFTYTPEYPAWMREHVRGFDFAHVHTVFSHPANCAMRACRMAGVPYCVRPLGQLCHWSLQQRRLVKQLQLAVWTRRNINAARFIHCTSEMEARETSAEGFRSPCEVLPHGIVMPPCLPQARENLRNLLGLPQDRPVVVFMSRVHPKKGIEVLLEAAATLPPSFDLAIVGTGDEKYEAGLRQRAEEALSGRVHWLGFKEGDDKWCVLQGADLFVLPSYSENFGISVLEAVACGLPVVISDQVALQDEVKKYQLGRVTPLTVSALAEALGCLLSSPAERAEISARAVATAAEHFSWQAAAHQLIAACRAHLPPT
jgi:glycosyltransferase involved in cell wall biosynthesis